MIAGGVEMGEIGAGLRRQRREIHRETQIQHDAAVGGKRLAGQRGVDILGARGSQLQRA